MSPGRGTPDPSTGRGAGAGSTRAPLLWGPLSGLCSPVPWPQEQEGGQECPPPWRLPLPRARAAGDMCSPGAVVLGGHICPSLVPSGLQGLAQGQLCVPLGTGTAQCPCWEQLHATVRHRDSSVSTLGAGTILSPLGMGAAQCPCVSSVAPAGTGVTLCPQWAGDSWNGCVTPRSVTLLVVLSPPLPAGGFGWCWGQMGTWGPLRVTMGSLMSPHPALTQEGINSSSVTSCHMPGAGRSPAPGWGHSCSWEREGWPGGTSSLLHFHRRGHPTPGVQAVPLGCHCHCPGNTDPNPAWGQSRDGRAMPTPEYGGCHCQLQVLPWGLAGHLQPQSRAKRDICAHSPPPPTRAP